MSYYTGCKNEYSIQNTRARDATNDYSIEPPRLYFNTFAHRWRIYCMSSSCTTEYALLNLIVVGVLVLQL